MDPVMKSQCFRRLALSSIGRQQQLLSRNTKSTIDCLNTAKARMSTQSSTSAVLPKIPLAQVAGQRTWESAHAKNPAFAIERELPGPKSHKREVAIFVAVAAVTWGLGSVVAFNYQRMTSTPVTAALFTARHNDEVREKFGGQLNFTSTFPWISGDISHLKGVVEIEFDVVGDKGVVGHLVLKSRRQSSNQNGEWATTEFYVETPDGRRIDCR